MIRVLGGNRGELALLCRRLFLGHRDISFDRHAVLVVPRLGLAGCAIKLELSMKGRVAGHILPVGAQINRRPLGVTGQREHPKQ